MLAFFRKLFRFPSADEKRLRAICRGDEEQMRRLIAFERERRPGLSERAAMRAAITRWKNDQR